VGLTKVGAGDVLVDNGGGSEKRKEVYVK